MSQANFIECKDIEQANKIDLNKYVFLDGISAKKGLYCFKIRAKYTK